MKRIATIASVLLGGLLICAAGQTAHAGKKKKSVQTWNLNVEFVVGVKDYSGDDKTKINGIISSWIRVAEAQFSSAPALKIKKTIVRKTQAGGRTLANLKFKNNREYGRFMDKNFDNVAHSKTSGFLRVLVVNEVCIGTEKGSKKPDCGTAGKATFPHSMAPFSRKHGIIMTAPTTLDWFLAHELGHFFSLKHTFARNTSLNPKMLCNRDFKNKTKKNGMCNSCTGTADTSSGFGVCSRSANVMDYCDGTTQVLNECQQDRAAKQRRKYMTRDGKVNYFELAGRRGKGTCKRNSDCDDGEVCKKGVLGLGRNQCKPKKRRR